MNMTNIVQTVPITVLSLPLQPKLWLLLSCLCLGAPAYSLDPAASDARQERVSVHPQVGTVSLVLGHAERFDFAGDSQIIEKGAPVRVGDRIVTPSNGHVHIRFVDDGLVSVRPNSELQIERYDYDPRQPELSAVKFNLQEGVARSISGDAAHSARDRFRLNTPIAAIGVRGTDFVVSADAETTRALVNEGIIILAPFSEACNSDALGPCAANALELTNTLQMVAMDGTAPLPRLLPAQAISNADGMRDEVRTAVARSNLNFGSVGENAGDSENSSIEDSSNLVASLDPEAEPVQATSNEIIQEGNVSVAVNTDATVAASVALTPVDFTPRQLLSSDDLVRRQLVWGRYSETPLPTERLGLAFEDASAGREISVGNLSYGLFRAEDGSKRVDAGLGIVGFQLSSAQAVFNSSTGVVAMQVNGGSLDIDFPNNAFATELNLNHELTGAVDLNASGRVIDGGFLRAIGETQRITGAVSLDGTEAGYLFEKQIQGGEITGLTLWDTE